VAQETRRFRVEAKVETRHGGEHVEPFPEAAVSIADLRVRVADVPGTQNLSMSLEGGKIMLRWAVAHAAAVDAAASDAECEAAIRNAAKLPPVLLIPDKPAPSPGAVPTAPEGKPVSTPADTMADLDGIMRDHVRQMSEIHETQKRILISTLARQRESVATGIGSIASRIDQQTDDFNSLMARWGNS
jgi:hypothetical protein